MVDIYMISGFLLATICMVSLHMHQGQRAQQHNSIPLLIVFCSIWFLWPVVLAILLYYACTGIKVIEEGKS